MNPDNPFSSLPPAQRISALLDEGSFEPGAPSGSVQWGIGAVNGNKVYTAATDPRVARGALGVAEARGLAELLARARADGHPVLLLLDSSGARVDEGLAALGAFRTLFREATLTRLAGVPMLAQLGGACFGGASMLACMCSHRHYLPSTRLATSGPSVIEAAAGKPNFNSRNAEQVDALMSGAARVAVDTNAGLVTNSVHAAREGTRAWLAEWAGRRLDWTPTLQHALLGKRLRETGLESPAAVVSAELEQRLDALLPSGYAPSVEGETFCALPPRGSGKPVFLGALTGAPVGADTCWKLAHHLIQLQDHPDSPIVLLLDANGHAATVADEGVLLSAYLVHLSLTIAWSSAQGRRSVLWITGQASGASYVAFAAPVDRVSVLPAARVQILPLAVAKQIVSDAQAEHATPALLVQTGVADALLDDRLYQQPRQID